MRDALGGEKNNTLSTVITSEFNLNIVAKCVSCRPGEALRRPRGLGRERRREGRKGETREREREGG